MKYIILICDGAADWPNEELGNKTIFEAAETPSMDWVASHGQMGMLKTIPEGKDADSAIANMTIMGYDPKTEFTGRGPLEALARGSLSENEIAFRCNIINIEDGIINDYSSGHITTDEAKHLIDKLTYTTGADFSAGVQYRHILKLDGNVYSADIHQYPPHDHLGKPYRDFLATPINPNDEKAKKTADYLNYLIEESNDILINHKINLKRAEEGTVVATHIWPWGGGKKPDLKSFKQKYGLEGAVISAVDLIFGIGIAA
jgi:2,3-bisphosphoglycerate-independent phosphoglycerate mutase